MASVLLVDDNDLFRGFLTEWLESRGYEVTACATAQVALEYVRRRHYSAVLTDILMPDMDGIELILALRLQQPAVPVIALSGGGQHKAVDVYLSNAAHLGAAATLGKPVDLMTLQQILARLIPEDAG